jgi:hypothetical protein
MGPIQARQEKNGFFYRTFFAKGEREELSELQANVENSRFREDGARETYKNQQAKERKDLEDRYERERIVDEQRIKEAFETGRIPNPKTRDYSRENAAYDRATKRGEGIHRGDGLHL